MGKRAKVGLALGAGGARGIAHVGVLKVLEREGIPIDIIVGTSIGALVGAAYAANPDAEALEKRVVEVLGPEGDEQKGLKLLERAYWEVEFKPDFFHRIVRIAQKEMFLSLALFRSALLSKDDLRESVEAFLPDINLGETRIPYHPITTDLVSGRKVVLKQGSLIRAVMASCAVPGFMPSVSWDDMILVDGGVIDAFPVVAARESGADVVIGVDVGSFLDRNPNVEDGIDAINRATEIMNYYLSALGRTNAEVVIDPEVRHFAWTSFSAYEELIREGEKAAELKIKAIKEIVNPGFRNSLRRWSKKWFARPEKEINGLNSIAFEGMAHREEKF
jgi:NTE family protein